jgi:hypothetical protein
MRTLRMMVASALAISGCSASSEESLEVFPAVAHTGVDGAGTPFRVPVIAIGADSVTFTASNDSITVTSTADHATITAVRAGMATLQVTSGAGSKTVSVEVKQYPAAARMTGAQAATRLACMGCHATNGSDITSSGIAEHTDDEVIASTVRGTNPEGGTIPDHAFALTTDEQIGMAAYLRSLAPLGDPKPDE